MAAIAVVIAGWGKNLPPTPIVDRLRRLRGCATAIPAFAGIGFSHAA